ncbi:MAG: ribosome recycling factor [Candidatus Berkelbacteria bacterium]
MLQPIINKIGPKMDEVVAKLKEDLQTIRTGKASASLVDNISVSYYGASTPLKNMANVSTPDASLISIQPWDISSLNDIETALRNSNLGFGITNDGRVIRISLPPLTQERRLEFVKLTHQKAEASRIVLRTLREEAWKEIQALEKAGSLTEDDRYRGEELLNKEIADYNKKILELSELKEKELMTM